MQLAKKIINTYLIYKYKSNSVSILTKKYIF
jgi:hypothetical protein